MMNLNDFHFDESFHIDWDPNLSFFIRNLISSKEELLKIEYTKTLKNYDKAKFEFEAALGLITFLKKFEFIENKDKDLFIAHSKYNFWDFLIFSIALKLYGKYPNLYFLHFGWAEDIINKIKQINSNIDLESLIRFIDIEDFKSSYNIDGSKTKLLSFTSFLNTPRNSIPDFSTCIVTSDSDIDIVCEFILQNSFDFAGFKENSIRRVLIDQKVFDIFIDKLLKKFNFYMSLDSSIISQKYKESIKNLYLEAISDGAEVFWGSTFLRDDDFDHNTILINVNPNMRIYSKRFFGPILCIIPFKDKDSELPNLIRKQPSKGLIVFQQEFFLDNLELNLKVLNRSEFTLRKYRESDAILTNTQLMYLLDNLDLYQL